MRAITVVTISSDIDTTLSVLMWFCLILIPLVALLQVYKSSVLNVLESVYLSCLLAMAFLSIGKHMEELYIVTSISLCLFIAILLFHLYHQVKSTRFVDFISKAIRSTRKTQATIQVNQNEDEVMGKVPVSVVGIPGQEEEREPLLAMNEVS